jgi:hypothetical protein
MVFCVNITQSKTVLSGSRSRVPDRNSLNITVIYGQIRFSLIIRSPFRSLHKKKFAIVRVTDRMNRIKTAKSLQLLRNLYPVL